MQLIGTHNSGTGEESSGIVSKLLVPFSRTQSKSIKEQYEHGCRYFDIRVRLDKKNNFILCHGLWKSKTTLHDVLRYLNEKGHSYVMVTYEGSLSSDVAELVFESAIMEIFERYPRIQLTTINVKKPKWKCLKNIYDLFAIQGYKVLDGSSWHTYLPIPWLWKQIYNKENKFNDEFYTFVDFL